MVEDLIRDPEGHGTGPGDLPAERRRLRALALLAGAVTVLGAVLLASSRLQELLGLMVLGLVARTAFRPRTLPVLIVAGALSLALVLSGQDSLGRWLLLPVIVGFIVTVELLSGVGRMIGPVPRSTGTEFAAAGTRAGIAGAAYTGVLFVGAPFMLPGPLAMAVVALALGALVWLVPRL